jgi:DNA repair photolyase
MARAAPFSQPSRRRPGEERPPNGMKGRGARSNDSGRYEPTSRQAVHDGWEIDEPYAKFKTEVTLERPRTIINYVESPFVGFDRSINPYRGCEHGCTYCFARPTHAYYGLSAGIDFEAKLFAKPNAAQLLEKEFRAKTYQPRHIAIGTNTDPYQPIERTHRIMRSLLPVFLKFSHPLSLLTKSALIERDIDLLSEMAARGLVRAMLSITTLDAKLARTMEPRASAPAKRLEAVRKLANAGVPVGVMTAPIIPGLNDSEIEILVDAVKDAGAGWAGYTIIRLPLEVADLFREWVEGAYPDRAQRVMNHIRGMNGGRDYDISLGRSKQPKTTYARLIDARFKAACRRVGLPTEIPLLEATAFKRPVEKGDQLSLFME